MGGNYSAFFTDPEGSGDDGYDYSGSVTLYLDLGDADTYIATITKIQGGSEVWNGNLGQAAGSSEEVSVEFPTLHGSDFHNQLLITLSIDSRSDGSSKNVSEYTLTLYNDHPTMHG